MRCGGWWDEANTDERAVYRMTAGSLADLKDKKNGRLSWDALFRNFNETCKLGRSGYRPGERIVVKVNRIQGRNVLPNDGGWPPRMLHNHVLPTSPIVSYTTLVDLMGQRHFGG
ncbi:MAG: hypothetical protein HXY18_17490, partial [Bryobacteraceae bacterium]|nr:hypothetical protein [Bryobacteraceae bacterium]